MNDSQPKNPLHGQTLEMVVNALVAHYGWSELGDRIRIRCFSSDPSVKSSLKFLRKTPWARKKVEDLFIAMSKKERRSSCVPDQRAIPRATHWSGESE